MTGAADLFARCLSGTRRTIGLLALTAGVALPLSIAPTAAFADSVQNAATSAKRQAPMAQPTEQVVEVQNAFDTLLGTEARGPRRYDSALGLQLASAAEASKGRIGVAALDLSTGRMIDVLGDQPFPMASTSKIAIAATFLEGVEKGKWSLTSEFPLMIPVRSAPFSTPIAPVRAGEHMTAGRLMELMLTRSNNYATDALLKVVGGPDAVNDWISRAGIEGWHLDRDIATLVRDDGAIDPAAVIDDRDSATPMAMVQLLSGLYQGKWLAPKHRKLLIDTMGRCVTGRRRIPAGIPTGVQVAHKTGSLHNTSSDVGIIEAPDGRVIAMAIYVTGQGSRPNREARIASIARTIYSGYLADNRSPVHHTASR